MDAFEFTVAHDLGIGVVDLQGAEQGDEGSALGWRAGVGGTAFLVEASFVADADGVLVVVLDVGAGNPLWAAFVVFAVAGDVPVVAAVVGVAFGAVTALQVFEREGFVAAGGAAVEDEPFHFFHREDFFLFHFKIVLEVIPPSRHATLDCYSSQNCCNDGCNDLQYLFNCCPFKFHKKAFLK